MLYKVGPVAQFLSGAMGRLKMAENNWVCLGSPLATDKGPPCSKLLRSLHPQKLLWNPKSEGLEDMTPFESNDFSGSMLAFRGVHQNTSVQERVANSHFAKQNTRVH